MGSTQQVCCYYKISHKGSRYIPRWLSVFINNGIIVYTLLSANSEKTSKHSMALIMTDYVSPIECLSQESGRYQNMPAWLKGIPTLRSDVQSYWFDRIPLHSDYITDRHIKIPLHV
jgi:hypothetical protein